MLYTNGVLLNNALLRKALFESNLGQLIISLDGINGVYEDIRGVDYEKTKNIIKLLIKERDNLRKKTKIELSVTVFRRNENHLEDIKNEWNDIVDHIYFQPRFQRPSEKRVNPCRELWRGNLIVLWDGRIVPCCVDFEGDIALGNAADEKLRAVFNNSKMRKLRTNHRMRSLPEPCSLCSEFKSKGVSARFS